MDPGRVYRQVERGRGVGGDGAAVGADGAPLGRPGASDPPVVGVVAAFQGGVGAACGGLQDEVLVAGFALRIIGGDAQLVFEHPLAHRA